MGVVQPRCDEYYQIAEAEVNRGDGKLISIVPKEQSGPIAVAHPSQPTPLMPSTGNNVIKEIYRLIFGVRDLSPDPLSGPDAQFEDPKVP